MGLSGEPVGSGDLEKLHLPARGVDPADGGALVRDVAGEPELAVEIEPRVVDAPARDQHGRRAERPVAAVVLHEVGGQARVRIERHVIFLEHDARRLAGRARIGLDLHGALAGAAGAREIGRQLLLVMIQDASGLALVADERAVDIGVLHQLDDGVPAGLVEPMLQDEARGVATGAVVTHHPLHALVLLGLLGQARQHDVAGKLAHIVLERRKREGLLALRGEVDIRLGGGEGDRLRPDVILALGQRREIVVAARIGEDRGGDGAADGLGRHGDAGKLLACLLYTSRCV